VARARQRALEGLQEPFSRSQAKRRQGRKGSKTARPSDPDLRIKRASVQRYRLRAELYDERVIAVPLSWSLSSTRRSRKGGRNGS